VSGTLRHDDAGVQLADKIQAVAAITGIFANARQSARSHGPVSMLQSSPAGQHEGCGMAVALISADAHGRADVAGAAIVILDTRDTTGSAAAQAGTLEDLKAEQLTAALVRLLARSLHTAAAIVIATAEHAVSGTAVSVFLAEDANCAATTVPRQANRGLA
jgi:hypothetical protein